MRRYQLMLKTCPACGLVTFNTTTSRCPCGAAGIGAAAEREDQSEVAKLRRLVTRLTNVAVNLADDLARVELDVGTEALAAIYCGKHFIYD